MLIVCEQSTVFQRDRSAEARSKILKLVGGCAQLGFTWLRIDEDQWHATGWTCVTSVTHTGLQCCALNGFAHTQQLVVWLVHLRTALTTSQHHKSDVVFSRRSAPPSHPCTRKKYCPSCKSNALANADAEGLSNTLHAATSRTLVRTSWLDTLSRSHACTGDVQSALVMYEVLQYEPRAKYSVCVNWCGLFAAGALDKRGQLLPPGRKSRCVSHQTLQPSGGTSTYH
jgi:hypothetical protein